ncbi:ataxin-7-like protein 1 isoform X1 [Trichogramma pretiosum]|uniref:ataxin-7-like protein 1 isoform X1 n=1 Tax=Trichogramma pretiosum TaxID=7493 RepID=UPI0006C9B346|nr:ataxin-7-like protein 1 isoform X1 [Trichogramma pretiosum]
MSDRNSPSFFHGQPWSSWIETIGRDKPLSKHLKKNVLGDEEEVDNEASNKVMRLSREDVDLYGFCPETDPFYAVICEYCQSIVKPQAFKHHIATKHSDKSVKTSQNINNSKQLTKLPICKVSKLKTKQLKELTSNKNQAVAVKQQNTEQLAVSLTKSPQSPSDSNTNVIKQNTSTSFQTPTSQVKTSTKRKKPKADRSLLKDREYDPDRHCGVWNDESQKPCTRSLTCKAHTVSLRRTVPGRSKTFDILLAEHRASKEPTATKLAAKLVSMKTTNLSPVENVKLTSTNQVITGGTLASAVSATSNNETTESPNSPPVLSLPDSYALPQAVDLLYRCLAPHGSNKNVKLEDQLENDLEQKNLQNTVCKTEVDNSTVKIESLSLPQISVVLPSLTSMKTSNLMPQYATGSTNRGSANDMNQQLLNSTRMQAKYTSDNKVKLEIDNKSAAKYSSLLINNKMDNHENRHSKLNYYTSDGEVLYEQESSKKIITNGGRKLSLHHPYHQNRIVRLKHDMSEFSQLKCLEVATSPIVTTNITNFENVTWQKQHPQPMAVSRWLKISSKKYNFNIH